MQLDPWQEEVLNHKGDLLLCTGRRVGKTYILARKCVDYMVEHKKPIICVSLTEDQSMLIIAMALAYARTKYPTLIGKGRMRPTLKTLTIKQGTKTAKMISRPVGTTGDATRGFNGGVLMVDEASRMPDLFWIAAKPVLLTQAGEIWMSSTPHGKKGYFWERFNEAYNLKDPKARFKAFYITTDQVMKERPISKTWTEEQRQGALRILEEDKKEMSYNEYAQEYLGMFLDDLNQFFDDELIEKCCIGKRGEHHEQGKIFLGVDIARMGGDQTAYEFVQVRDNKYFHVENITETKKFTTHTEKMILDLSDIWKPAKIGLDAGSGTLGVSILDHLMETKVKRKLVKMDNRSISVDADDEQAQRLFKEDMYFNLKAMMERGDITLLDDSDVKLSLKSVQSEFVQNYKGQIKLRIHGKFTHITEGLVRAALLARKEKSLNLWCEYT